MPPSPTGARITGSASRCPSTSTRLVARRHVAHHDLAQQHPLEVADVGAHRGLLVRAAVDVVEQLARQPAAGELAVVETVAGARPSGRSAAKRTPEPNGLYAVELFLRPLELGLSLVGISLCLGQRLLGGVEILGGAVAQPLGDFQGAGRALGLTAGLGLGLARCLAGLIALALAALLLGTLFTALPDPDAAVGDSAWTAGPFGALLGGLFRLALGRRRRGLDRAAAGQRAKSTDGARAPGVRRAPARGLRRRARPPGGYPRRGR